MAIGTALDRAFVELGYESREFDRGLAQSEQAFGRSVRAMSGRAIQLAFDEGNLTAVESTLGEMSLTAGAVAGAASGISRALAAGVSPVRAIEAGLGRALAVALQLGVAIAKHRAIQFGLAKAIDAARASQRAMLANVLQGVKSIHKWAWLFKGTFAAALLPVRALTAGLARAAMLAKEIAVGVGAGMGSLAAGLMPAAMIGGVAGLGAGLGFAVKSAADFEAGLSQVRKTTGLAGAELEQFSKGITDLATALPGLSSAELLEIAAAGGRLGIQGTDNLLAYTKAVGMMSIALDDMPVQEAATGVATLLNVFKLGPERTLGLASALNKLDDTSNTTARAILDITTRAATAANVIKMTAMETMALSATLASAGMNSEEAGSALAQILSRMTANLDEFAKMAGVSSAQFARQIRESPIEALRMVAEAISRLDPIASASRLEELGLDGIRVANAMRILSANFGQVQGFVRSANQEFATGASIQKEVAIAAERFWNKLRALWEQVRQLAAVFGSALIPALGAAGEHLAGFVRSLKDGADGGALKRFGESLVALVDTFAGMADEPQVALMALMAGFDLLGLKVEQVATRAADVLIEEFGRAFAMIGRGLGVLNAVMDPTGGAAVKFGAGLAAGDGQDARKKDLDQKIVQAQDRLTKALEALRAQGEQSRQDLKARREEMLGAGFAGAGAMGAGVAAAGGRVLGVGSAGAAMGGATAAAALEAKLVQQIEQGFGPQFLAEEMRAVREKIADQLEDAKEKGLISEDKLQSLRKKLDREMDRREALAEIDQRRAEVQADRTDSLADIEGQRQELIQSARERAWEQQGQIGFGSAEDVTKRIQQAASGKDYQRDQLAMMRQLYQLELRRFEVEKQSAEDLAKLNRIQNAVENV